MATSSMNGKRPWVDDDGDRSSRFQPVHPLKYDAQQSPRAYSPSQQKLGNYCASRDGDSTAQVCHVRGDGSSSVRPKPPPQHAVDKGSRKSSDAHSSSSMQSTSNKRQCLEASSCHETRPTRPTLPQSPTDRYGRRAETYRPPPLSKIDVTAQFGMAETYKSGYGQQYSQRSSFDSGSASTEQGPVSGTVRNDAPDQVGPGVELEGGKNCTGCTRAGQVVPRIARGLESLHQQLKLVLTKDKVLEGQSGVSSRPKLDKWKSFLTDYTGCLGPDGTKLRLS